MDTKAPNSLGNDFERMVTDKREVEALLRESFYTDPRISFLLKKRYKDEGGRIASELQRTLLERKSWLRLLLMYPDRFLSQGEREFFAEQAKASADALSVANTELAKLIEKTTEPPGGQKLKRTP